MNASPDRARGWPDADVVGAAVGTPVTVYDAVALDSRGELAHEGNRVPDIVALDARRLVIGWRAGVGDDRDPSPTDQGTIMYATSADGGATWTTGTLAAATRTHRYHYVIFLNDGGTLLAFLGRINVAANRNSAGEVAAFPVAMIAKRSTDAGRTWTDFPIKVGVPANSRGVVLAGRPLKHGDVWLLPYWQAAGGTTRAGVLRSADLVTWAPGALAANPPGVSVEEPQLVVSQDDPGTLLMVTRTLNLTTGTSAAARDAFYRANPSYAATATSTDGGLTWSRMTLDPALPNYYVKGLFTKDSTGRYLTVYNTLAGPFTGSSAGKPDQYREVLYYKVKRPGAPWGPGRLFADGTRLTEGAARGWDVYASADEYAPGRFFVVWEHNQKAIKVAELDLSRSFTGVGGDWGDLSGWTVTAGARTAEPDGTGRLRLADASSGGTAFRGVTQPYGPPAGFVATLTARVVSHSLIDPRTGVGAGLALKVATGSVRLMLALQPDGLYSFVRDVAGWSRVHAEPIDTAAAHTWQVAVDARGAAVLSVDGRETGARWTVAASRETPQVALWVSGTAAAPAQALVDRLEVVDDIAGTSWDAFGDWTLNGAGGRAEVTGGALLLRSASRRASSASLGLDVRQGCDFTLEFRGQVTDDSALDPRTGEGVSLGAKVANGQRRLMLTVQKSGVWTIRKGATEWEKIYSSPTAAGPATWKVTVDSAGVARLRRDGADTGATWVVQDSRESPQVTHWVNGTAGGNAAAARVEWTRLTATPPA
ncbi:hypothetical protein Sme01_19790 [Sphaerisporangium melleum]|uniref:Sialidase domain-containing protein n=1 Tax=Sphaerisporangium melleum TaxID=321316 RepID=A0A917RDW7_9ACTN|nr:sialidase family protein [Sphaerisporangium melleum]GGL02604.1 hypothetical protein GCM10007964_50840 [Sphaerisporangium melleum]GII69503.1 hypothetical protein Sme01_19790 [Sphaerisporangium melleum]